MWSLLYDICAFIGSVIIFPCICCAAFLLSAFSLLWSVGDFAIGYWFSANIFLTAGGAFLAIIYRPIPLIIVYVYAIFLSVVNTASAFIIIAMHFGQLFMSEMDQGDGFSWHRMLENRAIVPNTHQLEDHPHWSDRILRYLMMPLQHLKFEQGVIDATAPSTQKTTTAKGDAHPKIDKK